MRAFCLLLAACAALSAQGPAQEQTAKGVNFYSVEKEIAFGQSLAAETQKNLQAQPDARLQAIGDKLTAQTDGAYHYQFFVYTHAAPEHEPIALPGGPIFVAQNLTAGDDSLTAAVLAEAVAHIALRHYTRTLTRIDLMQMGKNAAPGSQEPAMRMPALPILMNRGFEQETDAYAVKLMIGAGYNPQAIVKWLQSMPISTQALAFGDRPGPDHRVAAVRQAICANMDSCLLP